jgi:hypothetical protein
LCGTCPRDTATECRPAPNRRPHRGRPSNR